MKLIADIHKIERDKRLKICQELREISSPLHQKINMRKERPTTFLKSPTMLKQNQLDERKGEDKLKRLTMPEVPAKLTQIRLGVISGETSSDLSLVKEPLLVEV